MCGRSDLVSPSNAARTVAGLGLLGLARVAPPQEFFTRQDFRSRAGGNTYTCTASYGTRTARKDSRCQSQSAFQSRSECAQDWRQRGPAGLSSRPPSSRLRQRSACIACRIACVPRAARVGLRLGVECLGDVGGRKKGLDWIRRVLRETHLCEITQ